MNETVLQEALAQVQERRMRARMENDRRFEEVNRKIPPLAEINARLAQTSMKVMELATSGEAFQERLEQLKRENLEAQQLSRQLLVSQGYPADYLEIRYTCERCQDTGYAEGRYCDCLRNAAASIAIARMNRNARMQLSDFGQFSLEYYKGFTTKDSRDCYQQMRKVYNRCVEYAESFGGNGDSLLFYGNTGLGKTHLSLAIARAALAKGYDVIYDSIINLLAQVEKEHFGKVSSEMDTLSLLLEADLLILDDLGTEFSTSFNISTVYNIINTRINRSLPTIISTNLGFLDIQKRYEERIVSRLFAVYDCLEFIGSDIRLQKRRKGQT